MLCTYTTYLGWLAGVGGLASMGGRGCGGRRPRPRAGAGEGGRGDTALLRFSRNADCSGKRQRRWLYRALPRHGSGRGTAAPRSMARQELPRQRSPKAALAMSALCRSTMHDVAQAFGRARAIGVTKSVSFFLKKSTVLDLKLYSKKG